MATPHAYEHLGRKPSPKAGGLQAELFDAGAEANENGDDFGLAATIIALVLFLAGVSLVLKGHMTRILLVISSGLTLVVGATFLVSLPWAGTAVGLWSGCAR